MAITANLLHMMDSNLQVRSVYGQGSTFYFDLKQRVKDWTPIGHFRIKDKKNADNSKEQHFTFLAPNVHVLLVDDNAMNRKVFCKLLKHTQIRSTRWTMALPVWKWSKSAIMISSFWII